MEDNRSINVDYIAVIRLDGNLVKYEQIDIPKPEGLLSDLEGIPRPSVKDVRVL